MDTLTELNRAQVARELEIQETRKRQAKLVIDHYAKQRGWTEEETLQVIEALGVDQPPRTTPSRLGNFNGQK